MSNITIIQPRTKLCVNCKKTFPATTKGSNEKWCPNCWLQKKHFKKRDSRKKK